VCFNSYLQDNWSGIPLKAIPKECCTICARQLQVAIGLHIPTVHKSMTLNLYNLHSCLSKSPNWCVCVCGGGGGFVVKVQIDLKNLALNFFCLLSNPINKYN